MRRERTPVVSEQGLSFFDEKNERRPKRTISRPVHAFLFGKPDSIKYGGYNLSFLQI
jgi:hypothetical protein